MLASSEPFFQNNSIEYLLISVETSTAVVVCTVTWLFSVFCDTVDRVNNNKSIFHHI